MNTYGEVMKLSREKYGDNEIIKALRMNCRVSERMLRVEMRDDGIQSFCVAVTKGLDGEDGCSPFIPMHTIELMQAKLNRKAVITSDHQASFNALVAAMNALGENIEYSYES